MGSKRQRQQLTSYVSMTLISLTFRFGGLHTHAEANCEEVLLI